MLMFLYSSIQSDWKTLPDESGNCVLLKNMAKPSFSIDNIKSLVFNQKKWLVEICLVWEVSVIQSV